MSVTAFTLLRYQTHSAAVEVHFLSVFRIRHLPELCAGEEGEFHTAGNGDNDFDVLYFVFHSDSKDNGHFAGQGTIHLQ